jgi:hypothetical protein
VSEESSGTRAVKAFEINDVFIVESACSIDRNHNPEAEIGSLLFGHFIHIEPEAIHQTRTILATGEQIHVVRYVIMSQVRILRPGITADEEPTDADTLASMRFFFAADYRCSKEMIDDPDAVGAFTQNAVFHVWPYFREAVHDACGRLRLPRLTIPMNKPPAKQTPMPAAISDSDAAI